MHAYGYVLYPVLKYGHVIRGAIALACAALIGYGASTCAQLLYAHGGVRSVAEVAAGLAAALFMFALPAEYWGFLVILYCITVALYYTTNLIAAMIGFAATLACIYAYVDYCIGVMYCGPLRICHVHDTVAHDACKQCDADIAKKECTLHFGHSVSCDQCSKYEETRRRCYPYGRRRVVLN